MSDSPDDTPDDRDEQRGGQPDQGGQPQGGQPQGGQPQGGHSQGGQPRGGQPQGGQPQGGQPQGNHQQGGQPPQGQYPQQAYQTGPGMGEIFNRPETKSEMKIGIIIYAAISVGLGITGFGLSLAGGSGPGAGLGFGGAGVLILIGALLLSPLIAAVLGLRVADGLDEQPEKFIYGTVAVIGFVGTLVSFVIGIVFFVISSSGPGGASTNIIGNLILPLIFAAIGVAIAGVIAAWTELNVVPGGGGYQRSQQSVSRGQR